jgi:hypothetical protein
MFFGAMKQLNRVSVAESAQFYLIIGCGTYEIPEEDYDSPSI